MHAKSTAKIINRKFGIRHYVSVNNGVSVLLPSGDFVQACGVVCGPHVSGEVRPLMELLYWYRLQSADMIDMAEMKVRVSGIGSVSKMLTKKINNTYN